MEKICPVCKKVFPKWKKRNVTYCSSNCFYNRSPKIEYICINCKKKAKTHASNSDRKYCSTKCMYTHSDWIKKQRQQTTTEERREYISKLHTNSGRFVGKKNPNYKHGLYAMKSGLRFKANGICQKCKKGHKGMIGFLDLHHINGNHEDNKITNLICVCPNCHRLLTLEKKYAYSN